MSYRTFFPVLPGLLLLVFAFPDAGEAQFRWGPQWVNAPETFGGAQGAGLRAGLDLPALPFDLMASGEYYFPGCGEAADGCGMQAVSLDASVRMATPLVRPYLTGGIVHRRLDPGGTAPLEHDTGFAVGGGVDFGGGGLRVFGEGRYEFVSVPRDQMVWRAGILLGIF